MAGALENFQTTACQISPAVLAGLGFICVWLGLCIWLGGLRWSKAVCAFTAACAGFAAGWFMTDRSLIPMLLLPSLAGGAGLFIDRPVGVLLAAALMVFIALSILAAPALAGAKMWENPPAVQSHQDAASLSIPESLQLLVRQAGFFASGFGRAFLGLNTLLWIACAVVILTVAGVGLVWPRGVCSLACAVLGVAGVGLGMFFLLIFKGSKPIDYLILHSAMLAAVASGMIAFGTLAGLALCAAPSKTTTKTPSKENQ